MIFNKSEARPVEAKRSGLRSSSKLMSPLRFRTRMAF